MDLTSITSVRCARTRADLALADGEAYLGGGTWLYSETQPPTTTGLVDLTTLAWESWHRTTRGLTLGGTCTLAQLTAIPASAFAERDWPSYPLLRQCADALLASFKIHHVATVGGNVARGFAAGGIVTLCAALDATALVWRPDGTDRRVRVEDLVVGNGVVLLERGEVVRALELPEHALRGRTAFRKIALSALGRSGAVLVGRVDDDGTWAVTVTAGTDRPVVLRYTDAPSARALRDDVLAIDAWFSDPHGTAAWRRAVSAELAEEIRAELTTTRPEEVTA